MNKFYFSNKSAWGKFIFWLCLLIWSENSVAQAPERFSIQLTAGAAIPLGKFGTAAFPRYPITEANGSALVGPLAKLKLAYQLNHSIGLAVSMGWQLNGHNNAAFIDTLKMRYPGYDNYKDHSDAWVLWNGMIGAFVLVPLEGKKLYLRPELNAGIAKTSIPGYSYSAYNQNITFTGPPAESGSFGKIPMPWAFCYDVGAYLEWRGTAHLLYSAGMAFFHTAPSWQYTYTPGPGPGTPETTTYPISTFQVNLSAGYRF
jgi:hypothetical protein